MFNWKRGGKQGKAATPFGSQEALCFFVGGATGKTFFVSLEVSGF
jgi:hypothetical protein